MTAIYHKDLVQGSDAWIAARCGILTASEMKHIITPAKLKPANNDHSRSHLYELLAQRITRHVEPSYVGDDMLRGLEDESDALVCYQTNYASLQSVGFITNDKWGYTLGYSPDALVGDDGAVEVKGRRQKYQLETILNAAMPNEFSIQVQTGLLVSERKWCDFVSYCGGMHMVTIRIFPNEEVQDAIVAAATYFHEQMDELMEEYKRKLKDSSMRLLETERRVDQEITL